MPARPPAFGSYRASHRARDALLTTVVEIRSNSDNKVYFSVASGIIRVQARMPFQQNPPQTFPSSEVCLNQGFRTFVAGAEGVRQSFATPIGQLKQFSE